MRILFRAGLYDICLYSFRKLLSSDEIIVESTRWSDDGMWDQGELEREREREHKAQGSEVFVRLWILLN